MAITVKQMGLIVGALGVVSFALAIKAEHTKLVEGTPIQEKNVIICKYPQTSSIAFGYLSFAFLMASSVVGYISLFYPYEGKLVPQATLFKKTSFLVFFNIALGITGLAGAFILWPTTKELMLLNHNAYKITENTQCPVALPGFLGGGAFLSLDSSLFWLVSLVLAKNAREDYFSDDDLESNTVIHSA